MRRLYLAGQAEVGLGDFAGVLTEADGLSRSWVAKTLEGLAAEGILSRDPGSSGPYRINDTV